VRRLAIAVLVIASGCSPSPSPVATPHLTSPSLPSPGSTPTASPDASDVGASPSTATADLPVELALVAWATYDATTHRLVGGLLGHPATFERTFPVDPEIELVGNLIQLRDQGLTFIDAGTGQAVARFAEASIRQPLPDGLAYTPERTIVDPVHRLVYLLDSGPKGILLRRFGLDGSEETQLARLGPDPAKDFWAGGVAIELDSRLRLVAISCQPRSRANPTCRLLRFSPGSPVASLDRTFAAPRPSVCFPDAVTDTTLLVSATDYCLADGGPPPDLAWDLIPIAGGRITTIPWSAALGQGGSVGSVELDGAPALVSQAEVADPAVDAFWPYHRGMLTSFEEGGGAQQLVPEERLGWVWDALAVIAPNWVLVQAVGPDYAKCRVDAGFTYDMPTPCPLGPTAVYNPATRRLIELPPGTYGLPAALY
jgi:hypothetical protein